MSLPFDVVWGRIVEHAGEAFHQTKGGLFHYAIQGNTVLLDRVRQRITRALLEEAYGLCPLRDTTPVQHLRAPSFLYAILMDPRIRKLDW